jgi:DNA anti-recombination protein RmuC
MRGVYVAWSDSMSKLFLSIAAVYVIAAVAAGVAAIATTLWAYNLDERMVSDTVTAGIINTAAAVAAMGFFGGFDMLFTVWQFLRNQEAEKARNLEREEERNLREQERNLREQERKAREEERQSMRAEREEIMAMLRAEHQRNQELHARVMELSELAIQRANGNTASERGE